MFSPADLDQLSDRGISVDEAVAHLAQLRNPPQPVVLDRPCTVGDGILRIDPAAQAELKSRGEAAASAGRVSKFVPASGAATRMFRDLIAALNGSAPPSDTPAAREWFAHLDQMPFSAEVRRLSGVPGIPRSEAEERQLLRALLLDMRYAELPKGLIVFHDTGRPRTAFEEHLLEATRYARDAGGVCRLHFTVGRGFGDEFARLFETLRADIESRRGVRLDVSFSEQHPSTDTLALDEGGEPFRAADGALLFRPAGHGALLVNLQESGGDVVVIKNIDNVVPDEASDDVVRWKRILIGALADVQANVFAHLDRCADPGAGEAELDQALAFAARRFSRVPDSPLATAAAKRAFLAAALERPIRVCGVVSNEGEPGGAPFWVVGSAGRRSIQIVEAFQVAADDEQQRIFRAATHFNPVDIVCGVRSRTGEPYDLAKFVDPAASFVSHKSFDGRHLLALERPGLWNGAMAGWNTLLVEVPGSTFAPVKTVLDLLRPQHQPPRAR
jgi:hypothetical protein